MQRPAAEIYQQWLDETGAPILSGDLSDLPRYISLPFLHRSPGRQTLIETRADMEAGYRSYGATLRALGVNHLIRLVSEAQYLGPNYIEGHHVTHALRNATAVIPRFASRVVLRNMGHRWKKIETETTMSHGSWPAWVARPVSATLAPSDPGHDARCEATEPLSLYQSFLNRMTAANVADDFEGYCRLLHFPCSRHGATSDIVMQSAEDARPHFDALTRQLYENGIEEYLRIADQAEFIGPRDICGYHTSYFLRGGRNVQDPITCRMILRREGTRWFMQSVANSRTEEDRTDMTSGRPNVLVTHRQIQERTKT